MNQLPANSLNNLPPEHIWLTIQEVHEVFKLSPSSVHRLLADGLIIASYPTEKKPMINLKEMTDYMNSRREQRRKKPKKKNGGGDEKTAESEKPGE